MRSNCVLIRSQDSRPAVGNRQAIDNGPVGAPVGHGPVGAPVGSNLGDNLGNSPDGTPPDMTCWSPWDEMVATLVDALVSPVADMVKEKSKRMRVELKSVVETTLKKEVEKAERV